MGGSLSPRGRGRFLELCLACVIFQWDGVFLNMLPTASTFFFRRSHMPHLQCENLASTESSRDEIKVRRFFFLKAEIKGFQLYFCNIFVIIEVGLSSERNLEIWKHNEGNRNDQASIDQDANLHVRSFYRVRLSFMYFLFCISKYTKCAKYIFQTLVSILFDRVSLQLSSYCIIMHHIQYQVYI